MTIAARRSTKGHLPAGEDRAACDAELMATSLALELAARGDRLSV